MGYRIPGPAQGETLPDLQSGGTLARTDQQPPKPAGTGPIVFPYHRCIPDNTGVVLLRRNEVRATRAAGFGWFESTLRDLDALLKGSSSQSWGMLIWGKGDGIDGTASRATADATLIGGNYFDLPEFLAEVDRNFGVFSFGFPQSKLFKRIKELREAIKNKDLQAIATWVFEVVPELDELRKEFEEEDARKKRAEQTPWADPASTNPSPGQKGQHFSPTKPPPAPEVKFDFTTTSNAASKPPAKTLPKGRVKDRREILPSGWDTATRVRGGIHEANGAEYIYTDKTGAQFRIREWCDGNGNSTYQLVERITK